MSGRPAAILPRVARTASAFERMRGLLGRRLAVGEGLLIAPCNSVHTWFMRFTIDAVFLSREGRIVKILRCLKPFRFGMALKASAVLEMNVGEADRLGMDVGDNLFWLPDRSGATIEDRRSM